MQQSPNIDAYLPHCLWAQAWEVKALNYAHTPPGHFPLRTLKFVVVVVFHLTSEEFTKTPTNCLCSRLKHRAYNTGH